MQWRNNCMVTWGVSRPLMMHSFLGGETKEETCWCLQAQAFNQDASVAHDSRTSFDTKYQIVTLQHDTTTGLYPFLGFQPVTSTVSQAAKVLPILCSTALHTNTSRSKRRSTAAAADVHQHNYSVTMTTAHTRTASPFTTLTHAIVSRNNYCISIELTFVATVRHRRSWQAPRAECTATLPNNTPHPTMYRHVALQEEMLLCRHEIFLNIKHTISVFVDYSCVLLAVCFYNPTRVLSIALELEEWLVRFIPMIYTF